MNALARILAGMGRNGDTVLAHVTPRELLMLRQMGGAGSSNPDTGLPEFYSAGDNSASSSEDDGTAGSDVSFSGPALDAYEQSIGGRPGGGLSTEGYSPENDPNFGMDPTGGAAPGGGGGIGGFLGGLFDNLPPGPLAQVAGFTGQRIGPADRAVSQVASIFGMGPASALAYGGAYGLGQLGQALGLPGENGPAGFGLGDADGQSGNDQAYGGAQRSGVSAGSVPLPAPQSLAPIASIPNMAPQGGGSLARMLLARNAGGGSPRLYGGWRY